MTIILSVEKAREKIMTQSMIPIDVRIKDEVYGTGKEVYKHQHLPGAVYLDFKEDISGKDSFFPEIEQIKATLEEKGIHRQTPILLYDEGNHRAASKAYVLFTYLGHDEVYILNGGAQAWGEAGYEWTDEVIERDKTIFDVQLQQDMLVQIDEVKAQLEDETSVHIDARSYEKYSGEAPSGYGKDGHIKGAQNFPAKNVVDANGRWKSATSLQGQFASVKEKQEHIVSCGTGNSACINVVALKEAGFKNVKLYAGGFKEWSQDDQNEIEKES
ncbi:sulfurtransferase [Pseudogracilibacillus sp. ICA-222130]|uniref:sulfurtransferase n=1 Tax=Pseudogracilibacillus sp. ICA-222130 TaxID=3134655 RepID=UPI0030C29625